MTLVALTSGQIRGRRVVSGDVRLRPPTIGEAIAARLDEFDFVFGDSDVPWPVVLGTYEDEVRGILFKFKQIDHDLRLDWQRESDDTRRRQVLRDTALTIPTSAYRVLDEVRG